MLGSYHLMSRSLCPSAVDRIHRLSQTFRSTMRRLHAMRYKRVLIGLPLRCLTVVRNVYDTGQPLSTIYTLVTAKY